MDNEFCAEQEVPSGTLTGINFSILSEKEAEKLSVKLIGASSEATDPTLGLPNKTYQCLTCGAKDIRECEGHFGLIRFPYTILHPYFISEVAQILNKICPGCKSIRASKIKSADSTSKRRRARNCNYCDASMKDIYPSMKFKISSKDIYGKTAIIAEVIETSSKRSRNRGSLPSDYWDFVPNDPQENSLLRPPNKRVLSHAQVYHILKDIDLSFVEGFVSRSNSIFLNCFPVTPNCHRVTELRQNMIFDQNTRSYKKLISFRGSANELSARVRDCLKISKIHTEKSSAYDPVPKTSGLKYFKDILLGKRTDHCFRMVVVGDPNIKLGEIGVPCHVAEKMQISEHVNSFNFAKLKTSCDLSILERGEAFVRRNGSLCRLSFKDKLQLGDTVFRSLDDGDIALINRPPSIHPHSFIALSVKILPINSVLSINPLICSPFRGDFDGDCLHGYIPQSMDSRVELRELVSLNKQLVNWQSGRNLLSLSHDSLTAAHLMLENGVLLNRFQMQQLQMFSPCHSQLPAVIKAPLLNSCLWTGKQLFSQLLPPDFDYVFPSDGVQISKGELLSSSGRCSWLNDNNENLFSSLIKHCQGEEVLDFLYAAQEVLCEWVSMRGLSVSLSDLYLSSDSSLRKNMMDEVSCGLREAERVSNTKLLMVKSNKDFLIGNFQDSQNDAKGPFGVECMSCEKQKSAALSQASVSAFKHVLWDIQNLAYQYASKDNSFLAMLKAGSKGNLAKMVQHGMCIGLQHSLVPLSFKIPYQLSCAAWNYQKTSISEPAENFYIPYGVVENSFLTGLNPLECFVHSLTNRDSSFGGHADISGSLTRKLMFFMRDLCVGYDGTVRNSYGNQVVQFSYNTEDTCSPGNSPGGSRNDGDYNCAIGGQPVGSLAACALSEAAYSALDQPISALETSPLLNLKKVLECGTKKISGDKTVSLFLSKKLGKWTYGFEYGALRVKSHLERVLLSDIVSTVKILFSPQSCSSTHTISPWVCHFHIKKEVSKRKQLRVKSIIDALYMQCTSNARKSKAVLTNLEITSMDCSVAAVDKEHDSTICITVRSKNSREQYDTLRGAVSFLLGTVIKGSSYVKKVDILWKDAANVSRARKGSSVDLYLQVFMSENCNRAKFWNAIMNDCLEIMNLIDWERSYPDDINDINMAFGVDIAWNQFLSSLKSAVSDTGKTILQEHLVLSAHCLSATGEFVGLSAKGLAQQRKRTSVSSPFVQACFSNPGDCFIKSAKVGTADSLQGSVDALSWGNVPSLGTGHRFDLLYSRKDHELKNPEDIYKLLGSHIRSQEQNVKVKEPEERTRISSKYLAPRICKNRDMDGKGRKQTEISKSIGSYISSDDIRRLSQYLKQILHKYTIDHQLSDMDKKIALTALYFHPRKDEKIGAGPQAVKIGYSKFKDTRCFLLERTDGTVVDFSYHKCMHHALELIDPKRAKMYQSRWLNRTK